MAFRTYVPGARFVLKEAHRFLTRYQQQLSENLGSAQYACLVDTIAAIASCLALLGTTPIGD